MPTHNVTDRQQDPTFEPARVRPIELDDGASGVPASQPGGSSDPEAVLRRTFVLIAIGPAMPVALVAGATILDGSSLFWFATCVVALVTAVAWWTVRSPGV